MGDTYYEIITPSRSIYATYRAGAPRNFRVGDVETFELALPNRDRSVEPPPDKTFSEDTTIAAGETADADLTTVENGVTLTIDGTLKTVDLDNNGTVVVNGTLDVGVIERLRVQSGEVLLLDDLTVADGAEVVVESDGVLQVNSLDTQGVIDGAGTVATGSVFDLLREYGQFAGAYATLDLLTNEIKYREQVPSDAYWRSLVVGVRPAGDLRDRRVPAFWGLVDDVRDARETTLSEERIEISVRKLAQFHEYNSIGAVETAFEV